MSNCNYSVYKHTNKENGKVYIGITERSVNERWRSGSGYSRQTYFYNAIQKYGWDGFSHEVLFNGLSKEEAMAKEIELIAYYQSNDRKYGYNIANGGQCVGTVSEETKRKISVANTGKRRTAEQKQRMCEVQAEIHSRPEVIEKMRQAKIGHTPWNKGMTYSEPQNDKYNSSKYRPIYCITNDTAYKSISSAARELGLDFRLIHKVLKGERNQTGGYAFRYAS